MVAASGGAPYQAISLAAWVNDGLRFEMDRLRSYDDPSLFGGCGERPPLNRFGSWKATLEAVGLELSAMGRRWSEDEPPAVPHHEWCIRGEVREVHGAP